MPTAYSHFQSLQNGVQTGIDLSSTSNALALAFLQLLGSSSNNALTHQAAASTAAYSLTWPAAQGTANQVLAQSGTPGTLAWVTQTAGANTSLSNLATTSINANMIPNGNETYSLGSLSDFWGPSFIQDLRDASDARSVDPINRQLVDTAGNAQVAWSTSGATLLNLLLSGSTSGILTQTASATTSSYAITWPAAQGSTNQVLAQTSTPGVLQWSTVASGSVSSVAQADGSTTPIFSYSGGPVTSSGTLTQTLITQAINTVFAGPASGGSGQPAFRTLVAADIPDLSATYVTQSEVGQPSGVASLDGSGKVLASQLPSTVLEYQGQWNPSTNTPALSDLTGTNGYVYQVSAAYAGPIVGLSNSTMVNFQVGNLVIYSSAISQWEQASSLTGVTSVNGAVGAVTVNAINQLTGDITAGPASGSASAAATLATVNSNTGSFGSSSAIPVITVNAKGLVTAVTTAAPQASLPLVFTATAGQTFAANTSYVVRWGITANSETATQIYAADITTSPNFFYAIGMISGGAGLVAGNSVTVTRMGLFTLSSGDTTFAGTAGSSSGDAVFVTASGTFSLTAPATSGQAVTRIGVLQNGSATATSNVIDVDIQVVGVI